jgi:hypothetical protein
MGTAEKVAKAKAALNRIRSAPKRRERNLQVDRERRTPEGHFHIAESYFVNARRLKTFKQTGHSEHAVRLLYYTALEVYLKAFLRMKNFSTAQLAGRDLGHRYCCLLEKARDLGLALDDEDYQVLYFLSYSDERERVRYIETGSAYWTDLNALDRTCLNVRELISKPLKEAGLPVRLLDAELVV